MDGFFIWAPHPSGNSSLAAYLPIKNLVFETPTPSKFPRTIHGAGMDILWNHTIQETDYA